MQWTACSEHPGAEQRLGPVLGWGLRLDGGQARVPLLQVGVGGPPGRTGEVPAQLGAPKNRPSQRVHINCKHFLLSCLHNSVLGDQGPFACQAEPGPLCVAPRPETALRVV